MTDERNRFTELKNRLYICLWALKCQRWRNSAAPLIESLLGYSSKYDLQGAVFKSSLPIF